MPQLYYEFLYFSLFVIVLVAFVRIRMLSDGDNKPALSRIITGLTILSCVSLVQLLASQQLLSAVPLFQEASSRKIIEATGIFIGLMYLLTGVGSFLPSLASLRAGKERMNKRYYCLKMIHQAISRSATTDDAYAQTMTALSTYLKIGRCAAFKYSSKQDTLFLSGQTGFARDDASLPKRIALANTELKSALVRFRTLRPADMVLPFINHPECIVPVVSGMRLYGAVICWTDKAFDDDLLDFMTVTGEMLGRYNEACVAAAKVEFHRTHKAVFEEFSARCQQASSIKDVISELFRVSREMTAAEYLSIAALDNSGENMTRYTIGSGGRILLEKGINRPTWGSEIYTVYRECTPLITPDATVEEGLGIEDGLFLSCGMRSRLACPVMAGRKVTAVVTLGHSTPNHFTPFHQRRLEHLINLLAGVIARENLVRRLEIKEDQMLQLQTMEHELGTVTDPVAFFDEACRQLTHHMNCTMARISTLDESQSHLVSRAGDSLRKMNGVHEHGVVPLSLLPWHRMALDAGKLMLINQEDTESHMQPQESTTVLFPDIKSAVLVPIMVGNAARGIISIGEQRNWNRRSLGATDLVFARAIADKCGSVLRLDESMHVGRADRPLGTREVVDLGTEISLRSRISDPLSSIIGAAELLNRQKTDDEFSTRYHAMILRSANRIKALTEDEETAVVESEPARSESFLG